MYMSPFSSSELGKIDKPKNKCDLKTELKNNNSGTKQKLKTLLSKPRDPELQEYTKYHHVSMRLWGTKWWISRFINDGYAEVHIWLVVESILQAQLW